MTINRNNYEELFLLYVDGELSPQDAAAVEDFVRQNPDLGAELDVLGQTKLDIAAVAYPDRNGLYRRQHLAELAPQQQELLLLYIDGELDNAKIPQARAMEYRQELALLQRTKLEPEILVFPGKKSLYRRERKPVVFYLSRFAAAAVMAGLVILGAVLLKQSPQKTTLVIARTTPVSTPVAKPDGTREQVPEPSNDVIAENGHGVPEQGPREQGLDQPSIALSNTTPKNTPSQEIVSAVLPEKTQPIVTAGNTTAAIPEKNTPLAESAPLITSTVATNTTSPVIIHDAVYRELNTEDAGNSVYIGNIPVNKEKLRGLLRKAGRLFKSRDEESKSSVAGIPLGHKS